MALDRDALRTFLSRDLLDFFVRLGLIIIAIIACEVIFAPFLPLMVWALILAVCFYPLSLMLRERFGWSPGRSATGLVLALILLIGAPTVIVSADFATQIFDTVETLHSGELEVPVPSESVKDWPVVGERVYKYWAGAATDLPATLEELEPHFANFTRAALSAARSTVGTLFFFLGALIVAGIMMAYGEDGSNIVKRFAMRLGGEERGESLHRLSTLTVRSVATGVVGVAVIQALLLGVGFVLADVPGAGLLALVVLVIGILQLPALVITIPVVAYLWAMGDAGTAWNAVLTVYLLVAGAADGFLKPMLLGRGVDVPMPIVLIGALGGMVGAGIIGLFVGAVVLSVGYELFMAWLDQPPLVEVASASPDEDATQA